MRICVAIVRYRVAIVSLLVAVASSTGFCQEWATEMFDSTSYDFKTVARGAKAQHRFKIENIYKEDCHIASVQSSCGCTTPQIVKPNLKTWEVGEIVADFNTRAFLGYKSAKITVTFDKPFYAQVELNVAGKIQSDVVVEPGEVDFGMVDLGLAVEKRITVTHAGSENWQLRDVKSANSNLEVEISQPERRAGQVSYDLVVRLTKDAPVGTINDQLFLVTNDPKNTDLPVSVEGRIVSEITLSPESMFLGVVQPGQQVKKPLVVSGKKPFRITKINCDDDSFQIKPPAEVNKIHKVPGGRTVYYYQIPVIYTAGDQAGKVTRTISIVTDQGDEPATFTAFAQVVKDKDEAPKAARRSKSTQIKPRVGPGGGESAED